MLELSHQLRQLCQAADVPRSIQSPLFSISADQHCHRAEALSSMSAIAHVIIPAMMDLIEGSEMEA
jgi:hypothetical protein